MNPDHEPYRHRQIVITILISAIAIVPLWLVTYPPVTDLPQHLAQVILLQGIDRTPELEMAPWYYPNTLVYLPIYALWQFTDPLIAGKITVSLLMASSIAATRWLAFNFNRPTESWLIALPLTFNLSLYWGFLNFLVGWPIYCVFLMVVQQPFSRRQTIAISLLTAVLYWSHALWFLCAATTLGLLTFPRSKEAALPRLLALIPCGLMAAMWYPQMLSFRALSGYPVAPLWRTGILQRFDPDTFRLALFDKMPSIIGGIITSLICGWLILSLVQHRKTICSRSSLTLLTAGGLMIFGYALLPTKAVNGINFHSRWLPFGMTLLLLALPPPRFKRVSTNTIRYFLAALFALFVGITGIYWRANENEYMSGFDKALAQIQPGDKVLGLAYFSDSPYVGGAQLMQAVAWSQVIRGATTNFSFAEHHSGLVNYRQPRQTPWQKNLEWAPAYAKQDDIQQFDKILMSGDDYVHRQYAEKFKLIRLTPEDQSATWHLYRPSR